MNKRRTHNDARVDKILDLVVAGLTTREIGQYVDDKTDWGIGRRTIDRLIARARDVVAEQAEPHRKYALNLALRRLDMLFARSLQINDFKACLAVERERIALLKLSDHPRRGPAPLPANLLNLRGSWRAKKASEREAEQN